ADFLDGLGIYVGAHEVALAHVVKRFFKVAVRHARTYPLPPAERAAERRQALAQAVLTFAREHRVDARRAYLCLPRAGTALCRGCPNGPIGLLVSAGETVELALLTGGRLVASQLVPAHRLAEPAEVSRSLARQLADVLISPDEVQLYHWSLSNGAGANVPAV